MMSNCLTCKWQPEWVITGYDSDKWATKAGFCRKPMPFTDRRHEVAYDEEWKEGLDEHCPAWEPKEEG